MGRRVTNISTELFGEFEHVTAPYPYPIQQHAFVGIVFWNKQQSDQHYAWFLKLPLDERGLLEQASRSQFLELVIQALGRSMEQTPDKAQQSALDHNPIIFKPSEQKLAAFTSHVRHIMQLSPSQFMSPALDYLQSDATFENWQNIGYQGFSDIAVRIDDPLFQIAILNAIDKLPNESFCALCCALENVAISDNIAHKLLIELQNAIKLEDSVKVIHSARALSNAKSLALKHQAYNQLINCHLPSHQLDLLVTLSGRYWSVINNSESALEYLEALSTHQVSQDVFDQLFTDLVFIPQCRIAMHNALRSPTRSDILAKYIANFISV